MEKVILNWLPPAMLDMPSPSMSILKKYLMENNIKTDVIYWNIKFSELQSQFLWLDKPFWAEKDMFSLLLFFNYLAIKNKDQDSYFHVKANLMQLKPYAINSDIDFFDRHMKKYAEKFENLLDEELSSIDFSDVVCVGFSVNLYQWVVASIIANKIKSKRTDLPIVIGGIGTRNAAEEFLKNFIQFDFAVWGEGEDSLLELCKIIINDSDNFDNVPNIAIRKNDSIIFSNNNKRTYVDLNISKADFTDYFDQKKQTAIVFQNFQTFLPIEFSRGCHWNRCHFCYLNTGYKFRNKSVKSIIKEIKELIADYGIYQFSILDNDVIGIHQGEFSTLLDGLIDLKNEYPDFVINLAEIITKDVTAELVKKMALAGFESVQIGYESPSNNLLGKIDKKNTFATNLLFIKFATFYKIGIAGANVLQGLLEETSLDIMEGINNLHMLRFFFNMGYFRHNRSCLCINKSSKYYKHIKDNIKNYPRDPIINFLPKDYIMTKDPECNILDIRNLSFNELWGSFFEIEKHYLQNLYQYSFFDIANGKIYREYFNSKIINELEFENESIELFILQKTNNKIYSFEELKAIYDNELKIIVLELELINAIEGLRKERLIYVSDDYKEIVSIVNVKTSK